jgi:hypothetical protein
MSPTTCTRGLKLSGALGEVFVPVNEGNIVHGVNFRVIGSMIDYYHDIDRMGRAKDTLSIPITYTGKERQYMNLNYEILEAYRTFMKDYRAFKSIDEIAISARIKDQNSGNNIEITDPSKRKEKAQEWFKYMRSFDHPIPEGIETIEELWAHKEWQKENTRRQKECHPHYKGHFLSGYLDISNIGVGGSKVILTPLINHMEDPLIRNLVKRYGYTVEKEQKYGFNNETKKFFQIGNVRQQETLSNMKWEIKCPTTSASKRIKLHKEKFQFCFENHLRNPDIEQELFMNSYCYSRKENSGTCAPEKCVKNDICTNLR